MIAKPSKITAKPTILVTFLAFFSLNFLIMLSVGNGRKIKRIPRTIQQTEAIAAPTVFENENKKIPIGIPKTQITLTTEKSFPNLSRVS